MNVKKEINEKKSKNRFQIKTAYEHRYRDI